MIRVRPWWARWRRGPRLFAAHYTLLRPVVGVRAAITLAARSTWETCTFRLTDFLS